MSFNNLVRAIESKEDSLYQNLSIHLVLDLLVKKTP